MCFFERFLPVARLTREHPCHGRYSGQAWRSAGGGVLRFMMLFLTPKLLWRGQSGMVAGFLARKGCAPLPG